MLDQGVDAGLERNDKKLSACVEERTKLEVDVVWIDARYTTGMHN